jgi:acyl carrier protein
MFRQAGIERKAATLTRQQFLNHLGELLETDAPLTGAERLQDLEAWDSLAAISFMAMADEECGVKVAPKDLARCATVDDLAALVSASFDLQQP